MNKLFDQQGAGYGTGDLIGLGSQSVRKNYYPALQERIDELEQERSHYKWLFENALHGIFQANLRGGFLACNPAMARICGYDSPKHLTQKVIRLREQLFCRSAEFDAIRQELLDQGSLSARETCLQRADHTPVHVAITLLRRPDLGPEVVEVFVADITERVQARQKLEQMNLDLERRVEERTEALQNAILSKDKYLAAASHDLLQPLNAAQLMISALQDSQLPAQESRMVHQVHRALEGAEELLEDLLDISKLDQQAMLPDLAPVNLEELLRGLGEEFEAVAANAGLEFRLRVRPAIVRTDPRMLTRIVRNLLSNAFRYTRTGGVVLAFRKKREQLRIEVWDTGVGIEQSKLREIFTEFHQLLPQGTGGRQGVGLGLAIVERMCRILGYQVDVTSRPGRGSRFMVTLAGEEAEMMPAASTPAGPLAAVSEGFGNARVLVIDNEPAVLESMGLLLERWGCQVVTVASEAEALAMLDDDHEPDVILADFHLNDGLTGCEAINVIRRRLGHEVPAAIVTADRSDETRRLMRSRHLPILNKPVKPNRLRALLSSQLGAVS
ncbi:MAG: NahK/ErcS family hybrid sensor histidine kinase/response regulator [Pseudomonadota bacterium]|nr:NahK/ErcS family hybrid sensor histidine kinase/response regulator [Pseudomonadota bacterium]